MDAWTDGWMDGWGDGWLDGWMGGRMDRGGGMINVHINLVGRCSKEPEEGRSCERLPLLAALMYSFLCVGFQQTPVTKYNKATKCRIMSVTIDCDTLMTAKRHGCLSAANWCPILQSFCTTNGPDSARRSTFAFAFRARVNRPLLHFTAILTCQRNAITNQLAN